MRNLDVMVLNSLNAMFKSSNSSSEWRDFSAHDPFLAAYTALVSRLWLVFLDKDIDLQFFQTVLSRSTLAANIDRQLLVGSW
jgi:hypothetical protein